jgi:VanZ family protein
LIPILSHERIKIIFWIKAFGSILMTIPIWVMCSVSRASIPFGKGYPISFKLAHIWSKLSFGMVLLHKKREQKLERNKAI